MKPQEIKEYFELYFKDKNIKEVTLNAYVQNVISLRKDVSDKELFSNSVKCVDQFMKRSALSVDTKKSRVVNFLRLVRSIPDDEFSAHFKNIDKKALLDHLGTKISELKGDLHVQAYNEAINEDVNEDYIPWTWIYNRANHYNHQKHMGVDEGDVLQCKLLAYTMILQHPPRRNEILTVDIPIETENELECRERASGESLNIIYKDKIFFNRYKTDYIYGEYVMKLLPAATKVASALIALRRKQKQKRLFMIGTSDTASFNKMLSEILDTPKKLSCNTLRHSFLTFYYSHPHDQPVFLHEKNDIAMMMGNSRGMHDRYIIRNKPYKEENKENYYMQVVNGRDKNLSSLDREIIEDLDNDKKEGNRGIAVRATPRRKNKLITEVLQKYKHLWTGKTVAEKAKEKPYQYLSTLETKFKGKKVKDILGSDPNLIKKWVKSLH